MAKKYKPKTNNLTAQQSKYKQQLDALKPKLKKNSQLCRLRLVKYNKIIIDGKVLSYVNNDRLFDLFKWEKPPEVKKAPAKRVKK